MIGSTVYLFDANRRVYDRSGGRAIDGPIWREHWAPHTIVAETSRSWVLSNGRKVPKRRPPVQHLTEPCYSETELAERVWLEKHRHKLADMIRSSADYHGVLACAIAIGYKG